MKSNNLKALYDKYAGKNQMQPEEFEKLLMENRDKLKKLKAHYAGKKFEEIVASVYIDYDKEIEGGFEISREHLLRLDFSEFQKIPF